MTAKPLQTYPQVITVLAGLAALTVLLLAWRPALPGLTIAVYLPLHTAMEIMAVVIAMLVFVTGWWQAGQHFWRFSVISIIFLGVALFDLSHLLSFPGMPDFLGSNTPDRTMWFWHAARVLLAGGLLLAILPLSDRLFGRRRKWGGLGLMLIGVAGVHWLILAQAHRLPALYEPQHGLTTLKISLEYLTVGLNLLAIVLLWWRRQDHSETQGAALLGALGCMILSSLFFVRYAHLSDFDNLSGHVLKLMSYAFIYRALVHEAVLRPWADLRASARALATEKLNAVAFQTREAIMITDADKRIVRVNPAFTEITGYTEAEVLGQNPSVLSSGQHDNAFYQALWQSINETGSWQGEILNRRKDGQIYPEQAVINSVRDEHGRITHYVASFTDLTEHKQAQARIYELAYYDPLTHLANRRLLLDRVQDVQRDSNRTREFCALLFLDLDHFNRLNDSLGHSMGDELLRQLARRLERVIRETDTLARPGGDEFILLAPNLGTGEEEAARGAETLGQKVLSEIRRPFRLQGHQYALTASVGITLFRDGGQTVDELMAAADLAMYQAKEEGRNQLYFYAAVLQQRLQKRNEMEADLVRGLVEEQFELFYQHKIGPEDACAGYEVLLRWHHPERGLLAPGAFIEVAETSGLIVPLGEWVLRQACHRLAAFEREPEDAGWTLAVNISERQISQDNFVAMVEDILAETGANPARLELEITETLLQRDLEGSSRKMQSLGELGIRFALDDFGTGYSSLAYLKSLPLHVLKIDQSFVLEMLKDEKDLAIVRAVIALTHSLDLQVVAEGVETGQHLDALTAMGCDICQGYYWGRPQPWSVISSSPQERQADSGS